jgi:hypothetical protein
MTNPATNRPDEGMRKGAIEDDAPHPETGRRPQHGSLSGQLGHRDQDEMLKENDTDSPNRMRKPNTPASRNLPSNPCFYWQ